MNDILRKIRTELRLSMNGIIATSMREKGIDYRMNFGVDIPKLRIIAGNYTPDAALAEMLWKEHARELKILATMLYPAEHLSVEVANRWCDEIPNQEIREQICMNLFQKSIAADKMVHEWLQNPDEGVRTTAYWLYARLALVKTQRWSEINQDEVIEKAIEDVISESYLLRTASQNALKFAGRTSKESVTKILSAINNLQFSDDSVKNEIYCSLEFEFSSFQP